MKNVIVVGGGVAGVLSAIMVADAGAKVCLVENTNEIGGLLRSHVSPQGFSFDYGTHFLRETGNQKLDDILLGGLCLEDWQRFNVIKNGNYFNGKLNEHSPFIDARTLPKRIYQQGEQELLELKPNNGEFVNLAQQLSMNYGPTFYEHIYRPLLCKFFHSDPEKLVPNSHTLAGLSLILIKSAEETRNLKKSAFNNQRIGFHSFNEGVSSLYNLYPRVGGIGKWVDHLSQKMRDAGIEIFLNCNLIELDINNHHIQNIQLDNGSTIDCDHVIWTVPPTVFLKKAGHSTFGQRPEFLYTNVFHFVADKAALTDLFFFACHDPSMSTYRVTLHANCQPEGDGRYFPFTVESLSQEKIDVEAESEIIRSELRKMNAFSESTKLKLINAETLGSGFPIPTINLNTQAQANLEKARSVAENITFVGKGVGKSFFMNDVLLNTFDEVNKIVST